MALADKVKELIPNFVVFDFEWTEKGHIYAASFVTPDDEKVLLLEDFSTSKAFIDKIQATIKAYPVSIGWNTLGIGKNDSDMDTLTANAKREHIPAIFDTKTRRIDNHAHIDLMRVFNKKLVQNSMYKNRYRDVKLETVSQCFLNRGKKGHGQDAHTYSKDQLKEYVLEDSRLVFELLSVGMFDKDSDVLAFDGALLETMNAIAKLANLSLERVCNGNLSQWWTKILEEDNAPLSNPEFMVKFGDERYQGGELKEPQPGLYKNVEVIDVQSLYPTMIENYNLSHEVVCCECCENDPMARVLEEILPGGLWICRKRIGLLAKHIRRMKAERVKQKQAGNTAQAEGLKILINGAYGLYGSQYFKYSDKRVAELVTAYARWINFQKILPIVEMCGFTVIYGDTDSLFCLRTTETANIQDVLQIVKDELNVTVEHEKTFTDLVISKKKHYIGRQTKKDGSVKIITKGIEWIKGDRGKWVNNVGKEIENAFKNQTNILDVVKKALDDLENDRVNPEHLKLGVRLSKNPDEYKGNAQQKKIGLLTGETAGNVAHYYKGLGGEPTLDPKMVDKKKYRELLLNTCEDVLRILGYDVSDLQRERTQTLDFLW